MSFAALLDHFDHIYIVNLPYRTDRRAETIAEFAKIGVAIPNDKITFFEATRPTEQGEFPSLGSLGNFISQTRVLADAMTNGHTRILICEDDLQLNDTDDASLTTLLHDLKTQPWSIAALGYLEPVSPPLETTGLIPWAGDTLGAQFWAIQGESIGAFHNYLNLVRSRPSGHPKGGAMFFDGAFNMVRTQVPNITFRLAVPCLAGQRSSRTDIHALRFYDRIEPFRSLVAMLRKLTN